jgi:hypothetical protein
MMDYIYVEAVRGIKATQGEYESLKAAINVANNNEDDPSLQCGDWCIGYSEGEVYIGGVFQISPRPLSDELLSLLGTLIAKNDLDYLEFSIGIEQWGPRRYGVTAFRVMPDGSEWLPTIKY